jgi:hypothetical protein
VKSKFRIIAVGAASVLAASITASPPASAVSSAYAYFGATGGTQIQAVGTTISSAMTAMSQIGGFTTPKSTSNHVASVSAAPLASVGAVNTSEVAAAVGDGWKLTGHARTTGVNLLNGLIKISAVDTTTTTKFDSAGGGAGSSNTQFLGLTIQGKTYPVDIAKNTTISVPGIATVVLNYQSVSVSDTGIATRGAGLVVTLLKSQATAAIGSTIVLNPSVNVVKIGSGPGGLPLGGAAYGSYVFSHVGDGIKAESGATAYEVMPGNGTGGVVLENHTARANLAGVLNTTEIASTAEGLSSPALNYSKMSTRTADLNLFPSLFGAVIHADAIGTNASVVNDNGNTQMTGGLQFVNLVIAGQKIPVDVGPNTTIHVAKLGYVTVNEQKEWSLAWAHVKQVIGLHVVLDTSRAGLPVGAEIQIAVSQAIVWG